MSILTEILREMYVDPELLEQLSMEQRDVLFRKMREEQVRRWRVKEDELEAKERRCPPKRTRPKIQFLQGCDGNPWVWVMGEHKDDLSYEELVHKHELEEMEKEKLSELQLRQEAEELAKKETLQIMSLAKKFEEMNHAPLNEGDKTGPTDDAAAESTATEWTRYARRESEMEVQQSPQLGQAKKAHPSESEQLLRRKTLERRVSIIGYTNEEQKQYEKKRADEVFSTLMRAKRLARRRAQEIAKRVEENWQESERRAKRYERMRRTSFKRAKEMVAKQPNVPETILEQIPSEKKMEIVRRMSVHKKPVRKAPPPPADRPLLRKVSIIQSGTKPKSLSHVVNWFKENEAPKGVGKEEDGSISIWFHGKLTRDAAQRLLESKPDGSYIVRLSSKIWGYSVSVKSYAGVKHFVIDATIPEKYSFVGPKQESFRTIPELLHFYRVNPITWAGQEVLLLPVGQEDDSQSATLSIFQGLYSDEIDTIEEVAIM